jgi:predicted dehydrogenase
LAQISCEVVGIISQTNIYNNISDALKKENANLVFDITIPEAHYDTVISALDAGCNVFGEKPMSDTLENAEKMLQHVEKTGLEYFIMQNRRYLSRQRALTKFLKSGDLGAIGQVSVNFQLNPHFGGFREEMDSPLIADMAIHTFDSARYTLGKNAESVYCHEFNPSWSWYKGDANAVAIFEMEDGIVLDYRGSWCSNGLNTSWESQWRIACADGSVYWDGVDELFYETTKGVKTDIPVTEMEAEGHIAAINDMFDCLENGKRPSSDCRDNINSIRMVYKAIESAKSKKLIMI